MSDVPLTNPNDYQVGGNHYAGDGVQHWDLMWYMKGSFHFRSNISKYLSRFHKKNGKQDIEKSLQYANKWKYCLISMSPTAQEEQNVDPILVKTYAELWFTSIRWDDSVKIFQDVRRLIMLVLTAKTISDVDLIIKVLTDFAKDYEKIMKELSSEEAQDDGSEPDSHYVNQDPDSMYEPTYVDEKHLGTDSDVKLPHTDVLKFRRTDPRVDLPQYAKDGDSGMDVHAFLSNTPSEIGFLADTEPVVWILGPGERRLVPTGLKVAIPDGYMLQVCSRSGLASKHGVVTLISPGIVDSGYRGELKVCLYNSSNDRYLLQDGERIAQLVLLKSPRLPTEVVFSDEALGTTERGSGGFGSTGGTQ